MPMHKHVAGSLEYYSFANLDAHGRVTCGVTSRAGGLSNGAFESLNLGMRTGDDYDAVVDNRAQLSLITSAFPDLLTFGQQVHGASVAVVTGDLIGSGAGDADAAIPDTDAMVTNIPDAPLVVLVADCCPVAFFDPVARAVGIAHAGWRGTAAGIVAETINNMTAEFGSDPADIIAGIGPSIGPCCYQVGEEVVDQLEAVYPHLVDRVFDRTRGEKPYFDLWQANRLIMNGAGLPDSNIETAGLCTVCHKDTFFSHRADGGNTGRFGALIMLHDRTRRVY
jgi:YfiH family protein